MKFVACREATVHKQHPLTWAAPQCPSNSGSSKWPLMLLCICSSFLLFNLYLASLWVKTSPQTPSPKPLVMKCVLKDEEQPALSQKSSPCMSLTQVVHFLLFIKFYFLYFTQFKCRKKKFKVIPILGEKILQNLHLKKMRVNN